MRFALLALLAGFTLTPVTAQDLAFYGVKVGVNSSAMVADTQYDYRPGGQVGLFAEIGFGPTLGLLAEVEYAMRGYGFLIQEFDPATGEIIEQTRARTTLHYVSVPVLMRLHMESGIELAPYVVLGPRLDFLVGSRQGRGTAGQVEQEDEVVGDLSTLGVSASAGIGLAFRNVLARELRLEGRFNIGFTNQFADRPAHESAYPQSLDVSVVIGF